MSSYNTLEDDNIKIEVLRLQNEGHSLEAIAQKVGSSSSAVGRFLQGKSYREWWQQNQKPIAAGNLYDHHTTIKRLPEDTFIITSAQNSTFVHSKFLESLKVMQEHIGNTRIIAGTFTYNKNGFQNATKDDELWFDPEIQEYILDEPAELAEGLIWCGELNILPTAVNPLSGLQSYTKSSSGIVPHAKMQLESIPTHKSRPCRMMYTTGAVTKQNYIQKKEGQKASGHHVFGALIVEVDADGDWFVRQINADSETGCFYDLDKYYTPEGVFDSEYVEGINWGDLHSEKKDPDVYDISFGDRPDSLINLLKPKHQFVHDVLDFSARSHHNINDPYFMFQSYLNGTDKVEDNIDDVVETLHMMERPWCQTVVVESNHDLALEKWLRTADYKTDPANAIFFLECQLAMYRAMARQDQNFSIFEHCVKQKDENLKHLYFLRTDESFMLGGEQGIECGNHGHLGANGSRGSINVYRRIGARQNIGHSHSAAIKDGVYQSGVSGKLDMGYNKGASSWSQSHIITYANLKRAIVTIKNGKAYRQKRRLTQVSR